MKLRSEGECKFCHKIFYGNVIRKHLLSCEKRAQENLNKKAEGRVYLLKASSGPFWVYFESNANSTLKDVDSFLRDLWLECCGHLSIFYIEEQTYAISPQKEYGDLSMNIALSKVIFPTTKFRHEYDYGTTTALNMECIAERDGNIKEIEIIARNNLPDFRCKCGKPAKEICTECIWQEKGLLCEDCVKHHKCEEDMLLPVVNSPRMGMCGYTGND